MRGDVMGPGIIVISQILNTARQKTQNSVPGILPQFLNSE